MESNTSPCNDGLTKELYCTLWNKIKDIFINPLRESKYLKNLSTSQRQAIIGLIEKPNKDKRITSSWRPISLLSFDQKIVSKTCQRLKKDFLFLIGPGQTVNSRFLRESGKPLVGITETCDLEQLEAYLLAIDSKKLLIL